MENYCNSLWPLIYDQFNHGRHEQELAFYYSELASSSGPVLEVACGTGMILLPLLSHGLDIYGFDISQQMLDVLFAKANCMAINDISRRVTRQHMADFRYNMQFQRIFIPARSFLHLATQEEQITCLRNIRRRLRDDGQLMLNFFTPSLQALLNYSKPDSDYQDFGTYLHPDGKGDIKVSFRQVNDLSSQVQHITWRFDVAGQIHESLMLVRWIYKNEFQLLATLSGFQVVALYSGFEKVPYNGEGEMVWILEKGDSQQSLPADAEDGAAEGSR